jgi:phage baseplate assembly protein W
MAIKDTTRKPFIEDNDTNVFIGIDLPIHKSDGKEGYFASTKTTIEAVKNNIKNVLNTERGERLMQPVFGLNLRKFLFEQFNDESVIQMQNDILDTLEIWLPFVEVRNITVSTNTDDSTVGVNALKIDISFNITQDPDTLDSVQIFVYDNLEQNNLE